MPTYHLPIRLPDHASLRTDIPYAALSSPDPSLAREHIFYVGGIPEGTRPGDLLGPFDSLGLAGVRVTWLEERKSAFLELYDPTEASIVRDTLGGKFEVVVGGIHHTLPLVGYWAYAGKHGMV